MSRSRTPLFVAPLPLGKDGRQRIKRLLIANRGEIACRIIATCKILNIVSIAVYTDPDLNSPHVKEADEAVALGPIDCAAGNPLLNISLLVNIAREQGADALHPGYGYLSENAEFSRQVSASGVLFVGPSPEGMSVLGDKRLAKEYIKANAPNVALVPGFQGAEQDADRLSGEAERIGYPVLIKASAGGGGRGMRIVHESAHLAGELKIAQSEAVRSFGSGDCILEKYIERSKHIEMQILGDSYGNVFSLFERECSIQRRHQKVIEETPSPWLDDATRKSMSDTAITVGKLIRYEGAGTVEFIVDVKTKKFYFLEVNTRIQVEHPVTEETTGLDIVALQLFVAAGGDLAGLPRLKDLKQTGHAIECRLCAEDPERDFMPDLGRIQRWVPATDILPQSQAIDVRFETGIETGSEVSIHFDSMIAKIVVWAPSRTLAISKMLTVLVHTVCIGLKTNQLLLQSCLRHSDFLDPEYSTSFIPDNKEKLLKNAFVEDVESVHKMLSCIPSIISQHPSMQGQKCQRSPFQSLPQNFRNQKMDVANVQGDVVKLASGKLVLVTWSTRESISMPKTQVVTIRPITVADPEKSSSTQDRQYQSHSAHLARAFNSSISTLLRSTVKPNDPTQSRVLVRTFISELFQPLDGSTPWLLYDLVVAIGRETFKVYAASGSGRDGTGAEAKQTMFMHAPHLGSPTQYHSYTLLSFGAHLRTVGPAALVIGPESSVKSPMPCKILSIVVEDGQTVAKGDAVMIIESMKIEIKMLATADGSYRGAVKEGAAVDEGVLLFNIE